MNKKEMEKEIEALKKEVKDVQQKDTSEMPPSTASMETVIKYLVDEREKTNRILGSITERIRDLEGAIANMSLSEQSRVNEALASSKEIPISDVDAKVVEFVQTNNKGMACANDVRKFMNYRGDNAACARLNKLYKMGVLERYQLGHKVYYKYDAGNATKTLIVSPPQ
ncbi:MAG: hypothetical protein ABSD68_02450 [Candidatus Micrarchaeales archaeon]|jgi:hypothetical protein